MNNNNLSFILNLCNELLSNENIENIFKIIEEKYNKYINIANETDLEKYEVDFVQSKEENNDIQKDNIHIDFNRKEDADCIISKNIVSILFPLNINNMFGRNFEDDITDKNANIIWTLFYIYIIYAKVQTIENENNNKIIDENEFEEIKNYFNSTLLDDKILIEEENVLKEYAIHIQLKNLYEFITFLKEIIKLNKKENN